MKDYAILFIFGLALLVHACKPCDDPTNPDCKNYDPCHKVIPVSADFKMIEVVYSSQEITHKVEVVTDTHLVLNPLQLVSLDSGELFHQWIIGSDPRIRDGLSETVTFGRYVGPFTVTHIVSGTPRTDCFPSDDGKDTVTKSIEIIPFVTADGAFPRDGNLPIYGKYKGHHVHIPDHTFEIEIFLRPPNPPFLRYKRLEILNLPDGCPGLVNIGSGANGFVIYGGGALDYDVCWGMYAGLGELRAGGDSLMIDYRYYDPDSLKLSPPKSIKRESTFIGIRQ